ncbi:MAG: UvrD-helicase domain-containing protein, partial [Bacteroidales bacterium]
MSQFLVYRASAGTGKTFTLVLKYLECILRSPDEYRKILAVTFTNKAADEMKERILRELDQLGRNPDGSAYAPLLEKALKLPRDAISQRAASTLRQMLHDYSRISVGTIDRFFQQILRAFAREEGISASYQVELDADVALEEVVARLIRESANDKQIKQLLVHWILHRMKSGKSWHGLEKELVRMGREILRENILDLAISEPSGFLDPEKVTGILETCSTLIKDYESVIEEVALEAEGIIARAGLTVESFAFGSKGPAGFLIKRDPDKFENSKRAAESINSPDRWVTKSTPATIREKVSNGIYEDLNRLMVRLFEHHISNLKNYATARLIIRNIHAFSLARYLVSFLRDYGRERDTLLMNLTQPIIRNIIRDNPTPFLFERTGTLYRHYLIDEFQDTSSLQWSNFRPLMVNCLSEGGLGMVVGDVKQSIYRWRNSNWRLLQEEAVRDLAGFGTGGSALVE